jgi:hypothetical protein
MAKKEEKAKVGRPKMADPELIKDSWYKIGACLTVAFVMSVCGAGVLTSKTPLEIITFGGVNKLKATVEEVKVTENKVVNLKQEDTSDKKATRKVISTDGNVTYYIPANPSIKD